MEGGMIVTNSDSIAQKVRELRSHCMNKNALERTQEGTLFYDINDLGYNYRLTEVQAALGISQLKRLPMANQKRMSIARCYDENLQNIPGIVHPFVKENRTHVYHLYVLKILQDYGVTRDEVFHFLKSKGIGLSMHYTPLHMFTFYKEKFRYKVGDFPVAEKLFREVLSLPIFPTMKEKQIEYVLHHLQDISCH
jgi:perosamine synthetase